MTSKGLETETGNRNGSCRTLSPKSMDRIARMGRMKETVFKRGGWQFERILDQILFLLVSVSNSYEVTHDMMKASHS